MEAFTDSFSLTSVKYSFVSCMVYSWLIPWDQSRDSSIILRLIVGEQWEAKQVEIGEECRGGGLPAALL